MNRFAKATAAQPAKRETAERALEGFLERARSTVAVVSSASSRRSPEAVRSRTLVEKLAWPEREVLLFLKGGSRVISLTDTSDEVLERVELEVVYETAVPR